MSTVMMRFVSISATLDRLEAVLALLKDCGDVETRIFERRSGGEIAGFDLTIAGHPFRVESVLEEVRGLGAHITRINAPPLRYLVQLARA